MKNNELSGMVEGLTVLQKYLAENKALTENLISAINGPALTAIQSAAASVKPVLANLDLSPLKQIQSAVPQLSPGLIAAAGMASQLSREISAFTNLSGATVAITALQNSIAHGAYLQGVEAFAKSLEAAIIPSPDIALIRSSSAVQEALSGKIKDGIPSVIKGMHVHTADALRNAPQMKYRKAEKEFYDESNPNQAANVKELNIIYAATDILSDLTASDLLSFLSALGDNLTMALEHRTGRKIKEIIMGWNDHIDFDHEEYYHARSLPIGSCPYTPDEICAAPKGVTTHGRFNWPGKSHYYFSDKSKGATEEIRKHSRKPYSIQIATIKPKDKIKMIDLSFEGKGNKFLEYCRFPIEAGTPAMRREYLIPCFVGDCCRLSGFDGIKYYGSKEYSNYVTWHDGHFSYIRHDLEDIV